ncbi:hypothetical protein EYR36_006480 [Pleurotus pulmonarius]|nr:hypothetical protein EYR36_006480 [Pleurotus pulmonarius]KAF4601180.1 hypothetical protein EYR38_005830 [Pleurotus pulmonarius]
MLFRCTFSIYLACLGLCFLPLFMAAPTSTADTSASTSPVSLSRTGTAIFPTSSSASAARSHRTHTPTNIRPTRTRQPSIPSRVGTHISIPRGRPTAESGNSSPHEPGEFRSHGRKQKPVAIFFEVLGGIAILALLLSLLRCLYSYKRTPRPDRVVDIVERHRLQREMEELRHNQAQRVNRRPASLMEPPPPPYFPRPPSYEEVGNRRALLNHTHASSDSMSSTSSHSSTDSISSVYISQARPRPLHGDG